MSTLDQDKINAHDKKILPSPTKYLPHRFPFLFVDRVTHCEGSTIRGEKFVSHSDHYLQGHFPQMPVFPGVIMLEALAQLSGVLAANMFERGPKESTLFLAAVDKTRFKRVVVPGDVVVMESELLFYRNAVGKFEVSSRVCGQLACSALLTMYEKTRDQDAGE